MSTVRINDKMPQFKSKLTKVLAVAINDASKEIVIKSKTKAPKDLGDLRSPSEPIRFITPLNRWIQYDARYARFQEFGGDSKKRVRKYTTAGTGAHYLRDAGDAVADKFQRIVAKYARNVRV